ncbi:hypothetical protein M405DRAFT_316926 [Rhizopogon salebrosus TDB-379]|nr:hypothetical protein M405DRAFT_316926 [Rhizopogon salebrosus TDB-379]
MRKRASSPGAPKPRRRRKLNLFVDIEADEDSETDDDLSDGGDANDELYLPVRSPQVTALPGPSAKDRLAANIDEIFDRYKENAASSPQSLRASHYGPRAAPFSGTIISKTSLQSPAARKMYRLRVQRTALDFIINYLRENGFQVFVSAWVSGDLYVAAESPNTIAESLPSSHAPAVREYTCISEEELNAVMRSRSTFPHPAWVRIKRGRYNGDIGYVFDSDQSNGLVGVLIPPRDFRDPTSKGSATLLDRCHLPNDTSLSDILLGEQVVGWSYKGEQYYKGLLLKHFHRECLELVTRPHVDDIRLHLQSGWDLPFLTRTKVAFSMQFLRAGDAVRVIAGELRSLVATVTSVDHIYSASLELTLDGQTTEAQVRLENLERVFHVGDVVRVVAGSYLGLEGYILEMSEEIFDLRQDISGEQYYLERHSLDHRFSSALPIQPHYEASLDDDDLQIGDHIKVLSGKHKNKRGVVEWLSVGGSHLWFVKETDAFEDTELDPESSGIQVPVEIIQRVRIPDVLKLTMDKGFDVKPGDHVKVARGPHYKATGIVQSVDFPNARLTLKCDAGDALVNINILLNALP